MIDPKTIIKIIPEETLKQVYEDAASKPVQETSKIAVDFIKAARLFTAPIQLLASYQDRLEKHFERVRNAVPEERQQQAPAHIAGGVIEKLKYLEDDNYLTDLYVNLLSRTIDKERVNEAHPAFFHIIEQLSPDEAMILYLLSENLVVQKYRRKLFLDENGNFIRWGEKQFLEDNAPIDKLIFKELFSFYIEHLRALNLVYWNIVKQDGVWDGGKQTHTEDIDHIGLTDFGGRFVKACVPEKGFSFVKGD